MKHKIMTLLAAVLAAVGVRAATYTWQEVNNTYSGIFTDAARWGGTAVPGEGYPADASHVGDIAAFVSGVGDYTVTFPEGTCTNVAAANLKVGLGETVRFLGENTTLVFPNTGTPYNMFKVDGASASDAAFTFFGVISTTPSMSFSDFDVTLSARAGGHSTLALNGGAISSTATGYTHFPMAAAAPSKGTRVERFPRDRPPLP